LHVNKVPLPVNEAPPAKQARRARLKEEERSAARKKGSELKESNKQELRLEQLAPLIIKVINNNRRAKQRRIAKQKAKQEVALGL
jgi:hypothetical protein